MDNKDNYTFEDSNSEAVNNAAAPNEEVKPKKAKHTFTTGQIILSVVLAFIAALAIITTVVCSVNHINPVSYIAGETSKDKLVNKWQSQSAPGLSAYEFYDDGTYSSYISTFSFDGQYDVICSGSLLGISYKRIQSNSVGYKTDYEMSSLDFEEFLWAKGYETAPDEMLAKMKAVKPFTELEHRVYSDLFRDFCITGGMPAIVSSYLQKGTFEGVLEMQKQLILNYEEDVKKYAEGLDKTRIINVLNHIPVQLAKENKKFQISKVSHGARFKDYWGCIEWLRDAGIVNICYCMDFPELPLRGNYDSSKYKLYFFDTGLLVANLDEDSQNDLRVKGDLGVYKGALYENIISESLHKQGYELYYYKKEDSTLEEDFFVRAKDFLIPVEVKATNGTAKSLRTLLKSEHYQDITYGIKFIMGNIGFANNIFTFPYFCSFLLKRYLNDFNP